MTERQAQEREFVLAYLRRNGTAYDDDEAFHRGFADRFGLAYVSGGRWSPRVCWRARTVLKQMRRNGDLVEQSLAMHGKTHLSRVYRLDERRHPRSM